MVPSSPSEIPGPPPAARPWGGRRTSGASYRRLAGNTAAILAGRVAAVALALGLSTVLFRTLGAAQFGLWSLFAYLVGYSTLVDFGLSAAVERHVAWLKVEGRTLDIRGTIGQALLLVLAAMAALEIVILGSTAAFEAWRGQPVAVDVQRGLRVLAASLGLVTGSLVIGAGLSGLQRMTAVQAWRTGGMALGTVAVSALALAGVRRLDLLLLAYAGGAPFAAAGQWWALSRELPEPLPAGRRTWGWDRQAIRQLLGFGGVLQVATIGPLLADYVFRLVISRRFGVEYAGIYDLAARAALGLRSLASSLFVAMVPFGVGVLSSPDRAHAVRLIKLAVRYTALFMLPCSALLVVVSDPVVRWWLGTGPGAVHVAEALRPLVVLHALASVSVPMAMMGRSAGRPVPEAVTTWVGVAAGVAAGILAGGFLPAVVAFGCVPVVTGLVLWAWLSARLGVRFEGWRDLAGAGLVTGTSVVAALAARHAASLAGAPPWVEVSGVVVAWATVAATAAATLGLIGRR